LTDSFYRDPDVTILFPCPNCRRLLSLTVDQCPHCRELIDETQKVIGAAANTALTQACSLANTISTGDPAVLLFLGLTVFAFLLDFAWMASVTILSGLLPVIAIIRWQRRYGGLPFEDTEFIAARRQMKQSLMLWTAFTLLECLIAYSLLVGSI
jgi:hypothetical protein